MNEPPPAKRLRFPKTRRLIQPSEFQRVRKEGTAVRGTFFILGVLQIADENLFRAGFVTSKKIGGAVVRNRTRRRMRELVRKHQQAVRRGIWLTLIARPQAACASFAELEDEWLRLATRASILAP